MKAEEEKLAIDQARASPELSPRQLALKLVDRYGCWVSESTADVYHGRRDDILARRNETKQRTLQARKEHNRKLRELGRSNSTG